MGGLDEVVRSVRRLAIQRLEQRSDFVRMSPAERERAISDEVESMQRKMLPQEDVVGGEG